MIYNDYLFQFKKIRHILVMILGSVGLLLGLWLYQRGYVELLSLWTALLMIIPVVVGGVLHMVVVKRNWLSPLAQPIHRGWFGKNKTWRGLLAMPLLSIAGALPAVWLAEGYPLAVALDPTPQGIVTLGVVTGLAYALSELPNSYLKRRLDIPPGAQATRHRWLFTTLDQMDSGFGLALAAKLVYGAPWPTVVWIFVLFPLIALSVKRLLYFCNLKPNCV